ncbi:KpsF/GutQ family sugar-phosphate isomerase [Azovibrio restrictus]|uniref:KpsF/GutQ family sugar-phosphate isomerase n=1 Tax=Azovibrio restrictus TaxID=146938 RepID=UPI000478BD18|nr:KpsF/GutQ family sugar-phosphate isomerase [Azovibrio restrictus]MCE1169721.1 KpsF/GutQ family sugar-phosphate isomerase [Azovibrio sp.]
MAPSPSAASTPSRPPASPSRAVDLAARTLRIEADALLALIPRLNGDFSRSVELILASSGRVIVSGMGKSGHVARKIAATLASTGTPAYFVHPGEASHGDLGMVQGSDVFLALSNSGETEEVLRILPAIKRQGAKLIAMTGNPASSLAREADAHLDASVAQEACPLNLAPTASTTAALALGDALAVALLDARGFGPEDFALSHPGGTLGRRLLTHVRDVMHAADTVPTVHPDAPLTDAILAMSQGGLGMTAITDPESRILGIFTDGDLRRAFAQGLDLGRAIIGSLMHPNPHCIAPERLAVEAVDLMERHRINQLLVADADGRLLGALNMHDLFRAKVI